MLQEVENGRCTEDLKMNVLQAIRLAIQGKLKLIQSEIAGITQKFFLQMMTLTQVL